MPEVGEIRVASEIGKHYSDKYIWQNCPECNTPRWVSLENSPRNSLCMKCHKERASSKIYKPYRGPKFARLVRKLKEEAKWTCSRCGWKAKDKLECFSIHVHHKDRNPLNNSSNNLEVLCSPCHHKTYKRQAKAQAKACLLL